VADLRVTQGGSFTCNTGWSFYVKHRMAVSRLTQGGSFSFNIEWQFYL